MLLQDPQWHSSDGYTHTVAPSHGQIARPKLDMSQFRTEEFCHYTSFSIILDMEFGRQQQCCAHWDHFGSASAIFFSKVVSGLDHLLLLCHCLALPKRTLLIQKGALGWHTGVVVFTRQTPRRYLGQKWEIGRKICNWPNVREPPALNRFSWKEQWQSKHRWDASFSVKTLLPDAICVDTQNLRQRSFYLHFVGRRQCCRSVKDTKLAIKVGRLKFTPLKHVDL